MDLKNILTNFLEENTEKDVVQYFMETETLFSYYRCAAMEVETKFRVLNEELSLLHDKNPIENIVTRIKTPKSIKEKLDKKGIPVSPKNIEENLSDVAGVRIICSFIEDIYTLADSFCKQDDITVIQIKDYIKNPKPNGYRSLHILVKIPIFLKNQKRNMVVEVQFRTIAMEFWANLEHQLRYKKDLPASTLKEITDDLNECANIVSLLDEKMQNIRTIVEKQP